MNQTEKHFQKSCQNKRKYLGEKEALLAARSQMLADPKCPDLDIYKCSYCSGWHLTSK